MMRKLILMLLLTVPASAHDCQLPPAPYDHVPAVPVSIEVVPWYHLTRACGYADPTPQVPVLYGNGGAQLFDLNRPNSCRWRSLDGQWHVILPSGGGWRDSEVGRCLRFEYGSINGWKHRDPNE